MFNWGKRLFKTKFRLVKERNVVDGWMYYTEKKPFVGPWFYVSGSVRFNENEARSYYQDVVSMRGNVKQIIETTEV